MPANKRVYYPSWTTGFLRRGQLSRKTRIQKACISIKKAGLSKLGSMNCSGHRSVLNPGPFPCFDQPWVFLSLIQVSTPPHNTCWRKSHFHLLVCITLINRLRGLNLASGRSGFVLLLCEKGFELATLYQAASRKCVAGWISHWSLHSTLRVMKKN